MITDLILWLVLLVASVLDVSATLWTIRAINRNRGALIKARNRIKDATEMELNLIPRLIMVWKLPPIVSYLFPILVISAIYWLMPSIRQNLFFFMAGAWAVVFQIHRQNASDLSKFERERP